jgi:ABC-type multidrug transport system ATPase subunit
MTLIVGEQTSGLDATSAMSIVDLLKALSKLGVTVICIIYQPRQEIFMSLDRLLLLAAGHTVYLGETQKAADYFWGVGYTILVECNPADAIMDITSGHAQRYGDDSANSLSQTRQALATRWVQYAENEKSAQTATQETPVPTEGIQALVRSAGSRGLPWPLQTYFCFRRSMIQQSRQPTGFVLEI